MSIAPTDIQTVASSPRWPLPVARRPFPQADPVPDSRDSTADDQTSTAESLATPGVSLTKLIAQLSRQLKALEKTFISALQSLARAIESAGTQGAAAAGHTRQAQRSAGANPYDGLIRRTAQRHELDPALLSAVIHQESGFDPAARSSAGAMGLMQLMPDTAKSLGVTHPYDPVQNVEGGARMLRGLIDRYGGRLDLALAAYNAGSGAVDKYHGVPPYAETRDYVSSILADYRARALS
jgi:soluble lytic murein transglycosylase-like protein